LDAGLIPQYYFVGLLVDETEKVTESLVLLACTAAVGLCLGLCWNYADTRIGSPCNRSAAEDYWIRKKESETRT
jgi:hypothetical protein